MLKVFLKIPGVQRPHAIVGRLLFEDERYLVILQDVIRRKILWENILYIEEILSLDPDASESIPEETPAITPSHLKKPETTTNDANTTSITVAFEGSFNRLFTIENVDKFLIAHSRWTPDLAKLIFTNPEIKPTLGSFVIKDITLNGPNITISTGPEKKDPVTSEIQSKVDLVSKIATAATKFGAPRTGRSSMRLPTDFSMSNSPFETPVPLIDSNDNMEADDVGYREEEGPSEI